MKSVPFFDYKRLYLDDKQELLEVFDTVASRGAFIMQSDLTEFESKLASYTNAQHAVAVANATDGLELSLLAIGLRAGDEVICCSHTMLATASAVVTAGGVPIPAEIGYDNLIDPSSIESLITSRTVGIMPTQLNGRTCDMDAIMAIANKHKLFIVEDAAQALGSRYKGQHAGTFGAAASISFFPAKLLGCFGDGGAVITNDTNIFNSVYQLHDHGRNPEGVVCGWGRNSRMDNLQAAFLNYKFKTYDKVIHRRREIATMYQKLLGDISEIKLPPAPDSDARHFDVYQNYELTAQRRDQLKAFLASNGVGTLVQWGGKGVHQWENLGIKVKLPSVEAFFENCIMLPMNIFISDEDIEYICDLIHKFYK